ncbi:hypothetical protein [Klebsiella pneumoniae]|uniref:hypothetical protein n=1 Tax=Klebsiella pneumoniae TaxID=573 RepID=UPI0013B3A4AA|nr:hypothetical protein [Klebsiella pneumoniae]
MESRSQREARQVNDAFSLREPARKVGNYFFGPLSALNPPCQDAARYVIHG